MTLHTVGPTSMSEDEERIGKEYQIWLTPFLIFGPIVALQWLKPQTVAFITAGVALALLHEAGGRLHDLCIRLRRTNLLLKELKRPDQY
jgi:hypothetical protein